MVTSDLIPIVRIGSSRMEGRMAGRLAPGALLLAFFLSPAALAQVSADQLLRTASQAPDLQFPSELSPLSFRGAPHMALYKPEGRGPFPALVLHHQCSGLANPRWQNASILSRAKDAVEHGYVVLLIDSLGPRHVENVCRGPQGGVNLARGVKDALQAGEFLRRFDFVDKDRVAFAGFSWGAMVGALASSKLWAAALGGGRFAAAVSFYPGCFTIRSIAGGSFEVVNTDIDRPLLVLMGDQDAETPPAECTPGLEAARAAGAPVEWHVYPGATHCWDCENLDNFSKVDARGHQVVYHYDPKTTQDSVGRMFQFLRRMLKLP
jgi:dienelactone hydrolase